MEGSNGVTTLANEFKTWPMLHGIVDKKGDDQFVTLLGVWFKTASSFSPFNWFEPPRWMELRAQTAVVGCHLVEPREACFIASMGTIENMTQWSRHSGIAMQYFKPEVGTVGGRIEITQLAPLVAELPTVTAKLHQVYWSPYADQRRSGTVARIRESATIEYSSADGKPLDEWIDLLAATGDLVSMSTLSPCGLMSIHMYLPPTPEMFPEDHPLRDQRHEVEIYTVRVVRPKPEEEAHETWQMVLTPDDLDFAQLLPKWMEVHERFASARGMILGLRYVTGGYVETQVVTAVAAAESFHRALESPPPIPPDEFASLRKGLLENVPPKFKSWLAARIVRNEPTLKQRLTDLATRPGEFMKNLVPNPEAWAKAAGDARNALAHLGASGDNDRKHLYALVRVTDAVVILNLLFELGIPTARLEQALSSHRQLSHAASLGREHFPAAPATGAG